MHRCSGLTPMLENLTRLHLRNFLVRYQISNLYLLQRLKQGTLINYNKPQLRLRNFNMTSIIPLVIMHFLHSKTRLLQICRKILQVPNLNLLHLINICKELGQLDYLHIQLKFQILEPFWLKQLVREIYLN